MMRKRTVRHVRWILPIIVLCFSLIGLSGCSKEDSKNPVDAQAADKSDCQGCHESESMLRLTAVVDTSSHGDPSGEG